MRSPKVPVEKIQELWERRKTGERTADLAAEVDVTPSNLCARWNKLGCSSLDLVRKRPRRAVLRELHARKLAGESTEDLAAEIGVKTKTLQGFWRDWLKEYLSPQKDWTLKEVEDSFARWEAGESTSEIAEELGVSTTALRAQWKLKLGKTLQNHRKWTREEAQSTWDRRLAGESTEDLAQELGTTTGALIKAWERILDKTLQKGTQKSWTYKELRETWALRMSGTPTSEIASNIGVSTSRLRSAWSRAGFKNPPRTDIILTPELVEHTWRRRVLGETGVQIAKDYGVEPSTLYTAWGKKGWSAQIHYKRSPIDCAEIWAMRTEHKTWREICEHLGIPVSPNAKNRLYQRLRRYCERVEIPMPSVPPSVR